MESERKYTTIWKKYLPVIRVLLKKALIAEQHLTLNEIDFKIVGDRKVSGYTFNLEINKGKVINDITGTVVAVTLFEVLNTDTTCRQIINTSKTKFSLGKNYSLQVKVFEHPI